MGRIFYRREDVDFIKFLFDNLSEDSIVLVPEQYSFYVERQSFQHLKKSAVLGIDIMGFSRLGDKILKSVGVKIDKISSEGKNMILTKIAMENKGRFKILDDFSSKSDFADMMQDTIRQLKQINFSREDFEKLSSSLDDTALLKDKLQDIFLVYEEYERLMKGNFVDSQDYSDIYNSHIKEADFLENKDIWICGFDAFDDKRLESIRLLNEKARSLNIILTYENNNREPDIFSGMATSLNRLKSIICQDAGKKDEDYIFEIDDSYRLEERNPAITYLERNLFSLDDEQPYTNEDEEIKISIVKSANPYNQAVAAASFIQNLLMEDENLRLRDIAILSNTIEEEAVLYKSVFEGFGMEIFVDERKSLGGNPIILYIQSLLSAIYNNFKTDYIIDYLKMSSSDEVDNIETLELYCKTFNIEEDGWFQDFSKGSGEYGEENIEIFNEIRQRFILPLMSLYERLNESENVKRKLEILKDFVIEKGRILDKIETIMEDEATSDEEVLETKQLWNKIVDIMSQMILLVGEEDFALDKTIEILKSGISSIEVGIIPPRTDSLIIGDFSRVKKGISKITLILSANHGILPSLDSERGFITKEDINVFEEAELNFSAGVGRLASQKYLDIYKNLASTQKEIFVSYLATDKEGNSLEKSEIVQRIEELFNIEEKLDPISSGDYLSLIGSRRLATAIIIEEFYKAHSENREPTEFVKTLYELIDKDELLISALKNIVEPFGYSDIDKNLIRELYMRGDSYLKVSPSRLEGFGKCPFAHFINYGIRPQLIRDYKFEGVDLGSIYHDFIKIFSQSMSQNNMDGWKKTFTKDEFANKVDEILNSIYPTYREGILVGDGEEEYRRERIREVCLALASSIHKEVAADNIRKMLFEIGFGKKRQISQIPISSSDEEIEIGIEGQIDRLDILGNSSSRIIDYKSGNNKFSLEDSFRGISLQLFIYLIASGNFKSDEKNLLPGGSFYFPIRDSLTDSSLGREKIDGFWREEIDSSISEEFFIKHKNRVWSSEYFDKVMEDIKDLIEGMARDIADGKIDALPKEFNNINSCTYCKFKGICKFDISLKGCSFNKES